MNEKQLLYSGGQLVIDRGSATIYQREKDDIFLKDDISDTYFLLTEDDDLGKKWLLSHPELDIHILCVLTPQLFELAKEYPHEKEMICYQLAYLKEERPELKGLLDIRTATTRDLDFISKNYDLLTPQQLERDIKQQAILIGEKDGQMVGFIGTHLEGTMGLLVVLPEFRRKGYGEELEKAQIINLLEKGILPICNVEVDNLESLKLQKKLGLTISEKIQYWIY